MAQRWSRNLPALRDMSEHSLIVSDTLLYFDGPVIFVTKIGFEKYLVSKVDEWEDGHILIASSIEDRVLKLLKENKISILGALRAGDFIVMETAYDLTVKRYWPTKIEEFDQGLLPDEGKPLALDIDRVADSVDQAEAYFSIRLSGDRLNSDSMSFHHFKKMVEKAYTSLRNLLAPTELRSSKSKVYDFRITEPEFGSLVINIDKPSLPSEKNSRRIFGNPDISTDYVAQRFWSAKDHAMANLQALKEATRDGSISDAEMSRLLLFIRDIEPLLPDNTDLYSEIEFFSSAAEQQQFLHLTGRETEVIRRSYNNYRSRPNKLIGRISIINEGSHSVVLKLIGSHELTCNFTASSFSQMKIDPNFKTGNLLTVNGVVEQRKRRDRMVCESIGIVSVPQADQLSIWD